MFQCRRQLSNVTQSWSWERGGRGGGGGEMKGIVKRSDTEESRERERNKMNWMRESLFLIFRVNGDASHVKTCRILTAAS